MREMSPPTAGQYVLARVALGTYLFIHYAQLLPWGTELFSSAGVLPDATLSPLASLFPNVLTWFDAPPFVAFVLLLAIGCSTALAVGTMDRPAALVLAYIQACLLGRNPLIANPAIPFIGLLLITHALLPAVRLDCRWRFPKEMFVAIWIVMSLAYSYGGYTKLGSPSWLDGSAFRRVLENPLARPGALRQALLSLPEPVLMGATWTALGLELLFAPAVLLRALRRWVWLLMVFMHLGLLTMVAFADLTVGMLLLHLFTFDRSWVSPRRSDLPEMLFYDGTCGLCHRAVRFVLAEDPEARSFRFAPLGGETFIREVAEAERRDLPDSLAVLTREGRVLSRSDGVVHVLLALGGLWRVLGAAVRIVPRPVRDFIYDRIAAVRGRLFRRPEEACPVMPPELRRRFDP